MITSRAEPANVQETTVCVFLFVTQWYHATNASHGVVCKFSKYSDGLKLRMLGPSSSRTPKECRCGNMFFFKTLVKCNSQLPTTRAVFFNESSAGKFCEILQGNMRFSAAHKMPPAKTWSSQHVKNLNPIF